ncbi:MAG: hypothetical protein IJZ46_00475, partial [Bacilli bacterium]|nr:hypothetical protein [Bacilli bacterium]
QKHTNSTLNIGRSSDELSTEIPLISGGTYGIYKSGGYTNFYNGRLRGYTNAFNGTFNNLRNEHSVNTYIEEIPENKGLGTYSTSNVSATATSKYAKSGNGYARITYIGETTETCTSGTIYEFDYTGAEQTFEVPCTGEYTLETWGAQGGSYNTTYYGGYGGYSKGNILLNLSEILYINVGGAGTSAKAGNAGGYNGGGSRTHITTSDSYLGSGGGATHIATITGLLSSLENNIESILIVSGGGGGSYYYNSNYRGVGGSGGGAIGGTGSAYRSGTTYYATGGTQTEGGLFGAGANGDTYTAGAGGGFYGGTINSNAAGGGSGYIANERLTEEIMYGYSVPIYYPTWTNMILESSKNFLQVGDQLFNTFDDAMDSISEEGTILQIADGALGASTIPENKKITLDMNGFNLSMTKNVTINGELTITNTSETRSKITSGVSGTLFTNNNVLNVSNSDISGYNGFNNSTKGTMNIDNVYLNCTNQALINSGTMSVTNSDIYGKNYALYSNTTLENTISNSTLSSGTNSIYKYSTSTTTITDTDLTGTINNSNASGVLNITNGIIKGTMSNTGKSTLREITMSYSINNYGDDQMIQNPGILTIEDSTLTYANTYSGNSNYNSRAIYNTGTLTSYNTNYVVSHNYNNNKYKYVMGIYNTGILTSNKDSFDVTGANHGYGIYSNTTNAVKISNITTNIHDNNYSRGINAETGTISIDGGELKTTSSISGIGLYINTASVSTKNAIYYSYNNTEHSRGAYVNGTAGLLSFESGKAIGIEAPNAYGIQLINGTLNLGVEDGSGMDSADVSTTDPYIQGIGTTTGIGISMGNGTFNFYDGLLTGSTGSRGTNDITSMTEKNYQVITTIDPNTGYETSILEFIK